MLGVQDNSFDSTEMFLILLEGVVRVQVFD